LDANSLKTIAFEIGQQYDDLILILASNHNGKAFLSCYISKPLATSKDLNASTIIRTLGPLIGGGGGGQAFFATAGGKKPDGIPEALQKASEIISDA
jgi:alanyl-tRNA synthetase